MKKRNIFLATILGGLLGTTSMYFLQKKKLAKEIELDEKNDAILKVYNKWMLLENEGLTVKDYLLRCGYKKIAVYGMHYLGENLCKALENTEIDIVYAIDKNANRMYSGIEILSPNDFLEDVDAIIVTAFYYYDEREETLSSKLDCPILSFDDILNEI